MTRTAITDLLEAGVHFGHQTRRWNPKMKPYIYGTRDGITIFDLTITMQKLAEACTFLRETVAGGGHILFVGAKRQAQETVRNAAESTGMFFMCDRWLGGTLTNNRVVLSRVEHMKKLQRLEADGTTQKMTKKEIANLRREREKLERTLGGIAGMAKLPAAMVVVDVGREAIAVREANKLGIPVVGIVDSNCNPDHIDYVIPGNDDALRAVKVIIEALAAAVQDARQTKTKGGTPAAPAAAATGASETAAATPATPPAAADATEPAEPQAADAEGTAGTVETAAPETADDTAKSEKQKADAVAENAAEPEAEAAAELGAEKA